MRLPRDLSGQDLAKALDKLGYVVVRQTGSHMRLRTEREGEHQVTVPNHDPLKLGTLNAILRDIAQHFQMTRKELLEELFA